MNWLGTLSGRIVIRGIVVIDFSILTIAVLNVYESLWTYFIKVLVWWLWTSTVLLPALLILAVVNRRRVRRSGAQIGKSLVPEALLVLGWLVAFGVLLLTSRIFAPSL
jgi:hypothetical protein